MTDEPFFIVWGAYGEDVVGIYKDRMKAIQRCRKEWKKYTGSLDPSHYAWVTENLFDDDQHKEGFHVSFVIAFTMDKP